MTDTLVVGAPPEGWPPFIIVGRHPTQHKGIMFDVLKEITARLGVSLDYELLPEKRSRIMLANGRIHVFCKAREWVDDPSLYLWSDPVVDSVDILVSCKSCPLQFGSVECLANKSIASVFGFTYPALEEAFASGAVRHHTAKDTEGILRMVHREHVDAAVTNRQVAEWIIGNKPDLKLEDFVFSETKLDSAPYRFAFSKEPRWERFVYCFNRELARMKESGRLDTILARYR